MNTLPRVTVKAWSVKGTQVEILVASQLANYTDCFDVAVRMQLSYCPATQ